MKEDVVIYAAASWFNEFSRIFDGFVSSGPKLPKVAVNIAINSSGLLVLPKEGTKVPPLLGLDFSQIKNVESIRFVLLSWILSVCYLLNRQSLPDMINLLLGDY